MLRKLYRSELKRAYRELMVPYRQSLGKYAELPPLSEEEFLHLYGKLDIYAIESPKKPGHDIGIVLTQSVGIRDGLPERMLYISEFGISDPMERGLGIGSTVFRELTENLRDPVFFYVLPKNEIAKSFWEKQIRENGYVRMRPYQNVAAFGAGLDVYQIRKAIK